MRFQEMFKEEDLADACSHAKIDSTLLKFHGFQKYHPADLLSRPGIGFGIGESFLKKYIYGWGKEKSIEEVLQALAETNSTMPLNWQIYTLDCGGLPAVIVIKGNLCDGFHRAMLSYLLGELVIGADFKDQE